MEELIKLQKTLVDKYIVIEDLPGYPIDLHSKQGRLVLKDFSSRLIEELAEATEPFHHTYLHMQENHVMEGRKTLRAFNEELGDVWSFLLEFIIFSGINTVDLLNMIRESAQEELDEEIDITLTEENCLEQMYNIAQYVNQRTQINEEQRTKFYIGKVNIEDLGGARIGPRTIEYWNMGCWTLTKNLTMAIHSLKIKAWAQSETKANLIGFYDYFGKFLLSFMQMMVLIGKTPASIEETYKLTNQKNHARIKAGY